MLFIFHISCIPNISSDTRKKKKKKKRKEKGKRKKDVVLLQQDVDKNDSELTKHKHIVHINNNEAHLLDFSSISPPTPPKKKETKRCNNSNKQGKLLFLGHCTFCRQGQILG
jgi:hypothetical protein